MDYQQATQPGTAYEGPALSSSSWSATSSEAATTLRRRQRRQRRGHLDAEEADDDHHADDVDNQDDADNQDEADNQYDADNQDDADDVFDPDESSENWYPSDLSFPPAAPSPPGVSSRDNWYPSEVSFPPAAPTPPSAPRICGAKTTSQNSPSDQSSNQSQSGGFSLLPGPPHPGDNLRWAALMRRLHVTSPSQQQIASLSAVQPSSVGFETDSEVLRQSKAWLGFEQGARAYDDLQASGGAPGDGSMVEDITDAVLRSDRSDRSDRMDRSDRSDREGWSSWSGLREMESRSSSTHTIPQAPPRSAVGPGSNTNAGASGARSTLISRDGVFWDENRAIPVQSARYLVDRGRDPRDATAEDILVVYVALTAENDVGGAGAGSREGEGFFSNIWNRMRARRM
ncbi:hypothetical protein JCM24511_09787 [Saitozyma sp. JCM 24511]|nr:hypothetical protein JCM24511_09787 [Saitozyma sp. JCM 24511]